MSKKIYLKPTTNEKDVIGEDSKYRQPSLFVVLLDIRDFANILWKLAKVIPSLPILSDVCECLAFDPIWFTQHITRKTCIVQSSFVFEFVIQKLFIVCCNALDWSCLFFSLKIFIASVFACSSKSSSNKWLEVILKKIWLNKFSFFWSQLSVLAFITIHLLFIDTTALYNSVFVSARTFRV